MLVGTTAGLCCVSHNITLVIYSVLNLVKPFSSFSRQNLHFTLNLLKSLSLLEAFFLN